MTHSFYRSYGFLAAMLACIVLGCAVGAAWPGAVCLEPLGTVFINMMFCLVVPLVFCSLAGSIANTRSRRRAGRILGATLGVFVVTGLLAAFIMLVIVRVFPPVLTPWTDAAAGTVDDPAPLATLLVNFFTVNDFSALLSRRAMLPLIVFSLLFGFSVSACGGPDTVTARVLDDATKCLLKMVSLVSCYAPIAFFGFFAAMVASYGAQITASYARAMLAYYPLCFVYALLAFPLLAYLGGGREGVRRLRRHILRPAVTALGTCSSVATIPANMEAAEDSGIPGGGYIAEFILCSLFFPDRMAVAYPIAVTIGNLVDPPATMVNAAGDYAASFLVARITEGSGWLERTDGERTA